MYSRFQPRQSSRAGTYNLYHSFKIVEPNSEQFFWSQTPSTIIITKSAIKLIIRTFLLPSKQNWPSHNQSQGHICDPWRISWDSQSQYREKLLLGKNCIWSNSHCVGSSRRRYILSLLQVVVSAYLCPCHGGKLFNFAKKCILSQAIWSFPFLSCVKLGHDGCRTLREPSNILRPRPQAQHGILEWDQLSRRVQSPDIEGLSPCP